MEATHFDRLARSLIDQPTRRGLLRGLAGALAIVAPHVPGLADASRKRRNTKRKKLQRNAFGCVDVGGKCRGNSANCCSGICQGKKPKKGKNDKSRCVGHDEGGCQAGQQREVCGGEDVSCTTASGGTGRCQTTTGNASYCEVSGSCFACQRDADCQEFCGPRAACIQCAEGCSTVTACVGPDICAFP